MAATLPGYPPEDLNQGAQLLQQLGSFWVNVFNGAARVQTHLRSVAHQQAQSHLDFLETFANVSRFTIPVFHTENWYLITIKLSEVSDTPSLYQPSDLVYGSQSGLVPNRPEGFIQTYDGQDIPGVVQIDLPDSLIDVPFNMQNLVVTPSKVWMNGIDFEIINGRIRFKDNPFNDPLVPHVTLFDANGVKVDEEIAIWVYRGQYDLKYIYTQFGYVLGLQLPSSEDYKKLLNAYWDQHLLGPSLEQLVTFLSALAGTPTSIDPQETVQFIQAENDSTVVITNTRVYRVPLAATVLVTVGETIFAGTPICDAVQVAELSGNNPDYSLLPALALSKNFLAGQYMSELTFRNHTVALEYLGVDEDNKAVVRFEVSGFPGDVDRFWNQVQANGKLPGQKTLAELLDTRDDPVGEPGPLNLPATVNPMQFILENVMRNNLYVIRVNQASFFPDAPGVYFFKLLRLVTPPHTTFVVFVELDVPDDVFDLSQVGSEDEPGYEEAVGVFFADEGPLVDDAYEEGSSPGGAVLTYGDVFVSAKLVSLTCQ